MKQDIPVRKMPDKELNRRLGRIIVMALLAAKRMTPADKNGDDHETGNRSRTS